MSRFVDSRWSVGAVRCGNGAEVYEDCQEDFGEMGWCDCKREDRRKSGEVRMGEDVGRGGRIRRRRCQRYVQCHHRSRHHRRKRGHEHWVAETAKGLSASLLLVVVAGAMAGEVVEDGRPWISTRDRGRSCRCRCYCRCWMRRLTTGL